jgi:hypothetical protein
MPREIALTRGKVAIVDDEDFAFLAQWKWYAHFDGSNWYARRNETIAWGSRATHKQRAVTMHRALLQPPNGTQIDHISGDGLDNRRANLRVCSARGNQCNKRAHRGSSSRFKGVSWAKRQRRWAAGLTLHGRRLHLGYFLEEEAAARAYDSAAKEHHGEFARLNFPEGSTQ